MAERKTESFVDNLLSKHEYKEVNYQGSEDKNIQGLLKSKSSRKAGRGKPEYTIKLNGIASDLLVIECKKDKKLHGSSSAKKVTFSLEEINNLTDKEIVSYAEDGVLHYMASLMSQYNVVGLAISGEDENDLEISTFITKNGQIVRTKHKEFLSAQDYIKLLKQHEYKLNEKVIIENIQKELPILHNDLRDLMKLSESEKPLLISACLLALQDASFKSAFKQISSSEHLASLIITTIKASMLHTLGVPKEKAEMMMKNFAFIEDNQNVRSHLKSILEKVCFLFDSHDFSETSYDVIGNFYNEFLKYTGGDKQGLGIVLTPKHVTDLFCQLGEIGVNSVVLDTCTGTGAFLISAMKHMVELANDNPDTIARIKKHQLIGIEQNPQMFTLACANMILRHDGKSNMYNGSCFDPIIREQIKALKPTVCLINPPYSQKDSKESELLFIKNALDLLEPNGKLVAIVPISSAIEMSSKKIAQRKALLKEHTLDAVFSMPDELFYPVGTITCIMVLTAHKPHGKISIEKINGVDREVIKTNKPTYFGYWKEDGFVKTKTKGRCDKYEKWGEIEKQWLENYNKGAIENGKSAKEFVDEKKEWCCEAYMTVDYNSITEKDYEREIQKYLAHQIINPKKTTKIKP